LAATREFLQHDDLSFGHIDSSSFDGMGIIDAKQKIEKDGFLFRVYRRGNMRDYKDFELE